MPKMSRREFLKTSAVASTAGVMQALWSPWLPRLAFAQNGVQGDTIVCIFLRGGADALNMIVPFGDDDYYAARRTLAIPRPDSSAGNRVITLDDFFGLNPDMTALHPLFLDGRMTAIPRRGRAERVAESF